MKQEEQAGIQIYTRLLKYLNGQWAKFTISIIGFLIFAASQPMLAKMMEMIISAIESKDSDARWTLPLFAVGIFLIRGIGTFIGVYYNEYVGAHVIKSIRLDVFSHLIQLPAKFYDETSQGQILHRLNSGVEQIKGAVTTALKTVVREGLTIIFLLAYIFYLNWQLSLIFLIVAPILGLLVNSTSKRFRNIARKNESMLGKVLQVSKELISNYAIVRGFGAEDYEKGRYKYALDKSFKFQLKARRIQAMFSPLSQLIISIAVAGIVFLLLHPSFLETSTTGELVGYLTAAALIPKPLRQLSGVGVVIQKGIVGGELIFNLLDTPIEIDKGSVVKSHIDGNIRVDSLSFKYPNTDRAVLNDISFTVKPGEMIALVGSSGSGKSTLSSLLYRLHDVENQKIFIDDIDVNDYKLNNLRHHIAVVNQHVALFEDSIRNNIAYGDTSYTDEQILKALEEAHALDFIQKMPEGLDANVGENGLKLSGGQRQRLAIARAFLKDARILILDEATSSLDNESEAVVTQAIEDLAKSRTTIVIAHRLSTILKADRLLVMQDGKIIEEGLHQDLLAQGGYYAKLFNTEYSET